MINRFISSKTTGTTGPTGGQTGGGKPSSNKTGTTGPTGGQTGGDNPSSNKTGTKGKHIVIVVITETLINWTSRNEVANIVSITAGLQGELHNV
jgi:hypothetical protein